MASTPPPLDLGAVRSAARRIAPFVHRTPVLTSEVLDRLTGARVFFKCENFQKIGAFKARGAHNAVFALSEAEAAAGVLTHSSGNHGAGLALAARNRGVPAHIVVPDNALKSKVESIRRYGGRIVFCRPTAADRQAVTAQLGAQIGARYIDSCNDPDVIAGQGTAALELLEDFPDLQVMVVPLGGGGLASGTCLAAQGLNPSIQVFGAEPAGADDALRSMQAGRIVPHPNPVTIADGLRVGLGEMTFSLLRSRLSGVLTVSEPEIVHAMRLVWETLKIVIEPSSAAALAAVLDHPEQLAGQRLGVIFSGGNVDLDALPWIRGS